MGYENPYVERYDGMEESKNFGRCWRHLSSEFEGAGGLSRIEILPEMRAGAGFSASVASASVIAQNQFKKFQHQDEPLSPPPPPASPIIAIIAIDSLL